MKRAYIEGFGSETVDDSTPLTVLTYTPPNTSDILTINVKFVCYNIDQDSTNTLSNTTTFIVANVTPALVNESPDSNFNIITGSSSLILSFSFNQSTSLLSFIITNDGSYAPEVACNWNLSMWISVDN